MLYIDIDIHHGDGVEEAFFHTGAALQGWAGRGAAEAGPAADSTCRVQLRGARSLLSILKTKLRRICISCAFSPCAQPTSPSAPPLTP